MAKKPHTHPIVTIWKPQEIVLTFDFIQALEDLKKIGLVDVISTARNGVAATVQLRGDYVMPDHQPLGGPLVVIDSPQIVRDENGTPTAFLLSPVLPLRKHHKRSKL